MFHWIDRELCLLLELKRAFDAGFDAGYQRAIDEIAADARTIVSELRAAIVATNPAARGTVH